MAILTRIPAICAVAVVLISAAGCDFIRDSEPVGLPGGGTSVHSVLVAGSDTVSVFVAYLITGYYSDFETGAEPMRGADVRIISGPDTLQLLEAPEGFRRCHSAFGAVYFPDPDPDPAGTGCYAAVLPGGVRAGARYELLIALPDGGMVHGAAVVPAAPELLAPEAWARFREDPTVDRPAHWPIEIPVRWNAGTGAAAGAVHVRVTSVFSDGAPVVGSRCRVDRGRPDPTLLSAGDSARFDIGYIACVEPGDSTDDWVSLDWDSLYAAVRVTSYDTAYTRYATDLLQAATGFDERSAPPEAAAAGLTGALGVFAGAAAAERPVTLLAESEPEAPDGQP